MLAHTTWLDFQQKTSQGESAFLNAKSVGAYYRSMRRASWSNKGVFSSKNISIITVDFLGRIPLDRVLSSWKLFPPRSNMRQGASVLDTAKFLPVHLRRQVQVMMAAERKAAMLQRLCTKEAARREAVLVEAGYAVEAILATEVPRLIVG